MSILSALRATRHPAIAFFALGLFWGIFAAFVPVTKARLGVSDAGMGAVLMGSAFGLITAMWLAPRADARLGARGMQVALCLLGAVGLLTGTVSAPVGFFFVMMLMGMSSGLLDVLMNARVSEAEARAGTTYMNANHGVFSLGYAAGALMTGLAREAAVTPFWVFAIYLAVAFALSFALRLGPDAVDETRPDLDGAFPWGAVALCGAVVLIAFGSEATVESWSALHIERTLHGGAAEGALGPATLGLTMALGRFGGQVLTDRLGAVNVMIGAACLSACGAVLAASAPVPAQAYLGFGVLGLGVSVIGPLGLAIVGRIVRPRWRVAAIGRTAVLGFSGLFMASAGMGFLSEAVGLRWAYGVVAVVLLMAAPLAVLIRARFLSSSG